MIWITRAQRAAQILQGFCAAGCRVATTTQRLHVLRQDHPVGLIIINDQDARQCQIHRPDRERCRDYFLTRLFFKFYIKPEGASQCPTCSRRRSSHPSSQPVAWKWQALNPCRRIYASWIHQLE